MYLLNEIQGAQFQRAAPQSWDYPGEIIQIISCSICWKFAFFTANNNAKFSGPLLEYWIFSKGKKYNSGKSVLGVSGIKKTQIPLEKTPQYPCPCRQRLWNRAPPLTFKLTKSKTTSQKKFASNNKKIKPTQNHHQNLRENLKQIRRDSSAFIHSSFPAALSFF